MKLVQPIIADFPGDLLHQALPRGDVLRGYDGT